MSDPKILHIATQGRITEAWNVLAALRRSQAAEPALREDPDLLELIEKKQRRFETLFTMGCKR